MIIVEIFDLFEQTINKSGLTKFTSEKHSFVKYN